MIYEEKGNTYNPFDSWTKSNSPSWWKAYNAVKHRRMEDDNYKLGNLENVFMALAGLYVLNRYYCKKISSNKIMNEPSIKSQIFSMSGWRTCIPIGNGFLQVLEPNGSVSVIHEKM